MSRPVLAPILAAATSSSSPTAAFLALGAMVVVAIGILIYVIRKTR